MPWQGFGETPSPMNYKKKKLWLFFVVCYNIIYSPLSNRVVCNQLKRQTCHMIQIIELSEALMDGSDFIIVPYYNCSIIFKICFSGFGLFSYIEMIDFGFFLGFIV